MVVRSLDVLVFFFFCQAEDGIRAGTVTGVQTCALPIYRRHPALTEMALDAVAAGEGRVQAVGLGGQVTQHATSPRSPRAAKRRNTAEPRRLRPSDSCGVLSVTDSSRCLGIVGRDPPR